MAKDNLETRVKKSVLKIEKMVSGIYNVLADFNLNLLHVIEQKQPSYYGGNAGGYNAQE